MVKRILLLLIACSVSLLAETMTISECADMSLIKSAYANNKGIIAFQNATNASLVMNSWRC